MKLYLQKPRKSHKPRPSATALRTLFVVPVFPAAIVVATLAAIFAAPVPVHADRLTVSDGETNDHGFGASVSASGDGALVGAFWDDDKGSSSGSVYYYKGLDGKSGTINETVKLLASDGAAEDWFGVSASLSGGSALVGAFQHDDKGNNSGSAYYYKGLNQKNGTVDQEDVKLLASDGAETDTFGLSVSLSGDNALVSAFQHDDKGSNSGAAYYYKGLNQKNGTVDQEDVKLLASDGAMGDCFGISVSLSGDSALVGAYQHGDDKGSFGGSAYYYKGLNQKSGTVDQEDVKLLASDGSADDFFGYSVSLSADRALVGANAKESFRGAAYYYKGLNGAEKNGTVYQDVKLLASDGAEYDQFGYSVSLSADSALVGARYGNNKGSRSGAAYYYKGLDGKSGMVNETVKLLASDGEQSDSFGYSVSLSGDRFAISARMAYMGMEGTAVQLGKAYAGDIRAFTTLDAGEGTALATGGISFVSQSDWIIGETTSDNQVTLSKVWSSNQANPAGAWFTDTADVTADSKAVYIGQKTGADNNTLIIEGALTANAVYSGTADNSGNMLVVAAGGEIHIRQLASAFVGTGSGGSGIDTSNTIVFDKEALVHFELGTAAGVDTTTGLIAGGTITFGGTLELTAGDDFEAVIGNEYKLFDFVTGESLGGSGGGAGQFDAVNAFTLGENLYWDYSLLYSEGIVRIAGIDPGTAVPEPSAWAAIAGMLLLALGAVLRHHSPLTRGNQESGTEVTR
jgi:hypothetical protein